MASTKEYCNYLIEQLRELSDITYKPMYLVEDVDNIDTLKNIILDTFEGLKKTSK